MAGLSSRVWRVVHGLNSRGVFRTERKSKDADYGILPASDKCGSREAAAKRGSEMVEANPIRS